MLSLRSITDPYHGGFNDFIGYGAKIIFIGTCENFCILYRDKHPDFCDTVRNIIAKTKQLPVSGAFFQSEISAAELFIISGRNKPNVAARNFAQICLGAIKSGVISNFNFSIPGFSHLTFLKRIITGTSLQIAATEGDVRISNDEGLQWKFAKVTSVVGQEEIWREEGGIELEIPAGSCSTILLCGNEWESLYSSHTHLRAKNISEARDDLETAFDVLERYSPHYYVWIASVLNQICPVVRQAPQAISSASNYYDLATVHIACPASPTEIIEMLVHECSHQYFHLATRIYSMTADDAPAVYSVLKHEHRPLEKILLGFHAFANCLSAMEDVERNSSGKWTFARRDYVHELTQGLHDTLIKNRASLTPDGENFFSTQMQLVDDRELLR